MHLVYNDTIQLSDCAGMESECVCVGQRVVWERLGKKDHKRAGETLGVMDRLIILSVVMVP